MYKKVNVVMLLTNEKANIFITSDEEIKGGDWCLNSYDNQIWQYKPSPCPLPYWGNKDTLTKIIATADSSLGLPQPSKEFIQLHCKKYNEGNIITEVEVEYEDKFLGYFPHVTLTGTGSEPKYETQLKVNSNNTINIKSIKDSWSREEVIKLCRSAHLHGEQGALNIHYQTFKQWIEENL